MVRKTVESVGISPNGKPTTPFAELDPETRMDKADFEDLLTKIDSGLRALPATAQVWKKGTHLFFDNFFCIFPVELATAYQLALVQLTASLEIKKAVVLLVFKL